MRTHLKNRFQRRDTGFLMRGDGAEAEAYQRYAEAEPRAVAKNPVSEPKWNFEMGSSTILLAHSRIPSIPLFFAIRGALRRVLLFLDRPAIAGVAAAAVAFGVVLYIVMLLMSFGLGMRLRDMALAHAQESEATRRMEVRSREQEAGFAERHRAFLSTMEEITALKYLTPENTALSAARGSAFSRP